MRVLHCRLWPSMLNKNFSTLLHKWQDFGKKITEHKMCVSISRTYMSDMFLILKRTEQNVIKKSRGFQVKYSLLLSDFNVSVILPMFLSKNTQISITTTSCLVRAQLFHAYGRTDGRKDGKTNPTNLILTDPHNRSSLRHEKN